MNKLEFIKEISKKSKMTQKDCANCLNSITQIIQNTLKKGDNVNLVGFGKFEVKHRMARRSFNPKTREINLIPATNVPSFKPGKNLKQSISKY